MTISPRSGLNILQFSAIALAVILLSPVTIRTLIPAFSHFSIAPFTSSLKMSYIPKIQNKVKPDFSSSRTPLSSFYSKSFKVKKLKI